VSEQPTPQATDTGEPEEAGNPIVQTMMDQLRQERASEATDHADIDVPGFSGKLVARYGVIDGKQLAMIGKRVQRQFKADDERQLYGSVDVLVAACEGLYFKTTDDQLIPIDPDLPPHGVDPMQGNAATYSHPGLGTYFGFAGGDARTNVFGLFKNNDMAIVGHSILLQRWMADTSKGVDEAWLGR